MITLAADLQPFVCLGVLLMDDAHVVERDPRLDIPIAETLDRIRQASMEHLLGSVRTMYRRFGIDPTKTRPSSEALLRRARKGHDWPRINSLVDVCNWCSVELQLPYGLYDRSRIRGHVTLRSGRPGEEYQGIRKDVVHLGGRPTLVDEEGPFGNPTSDSERTMVTTRTQDVLVVIFAPREIGQTRVERALDLTASRMATFTGARETERAIV